MQTAPGLMTVSPFVIPSLDKAKPMIIYTLVKFWKVNYYFFKNLLLEMMPVVEN